MPRLLKSFFASLVLSAAPAFAQTPAEPVVELPDHTVLGDDVFSRLDAPDYTPARSLFALGVAAPRSVSWLSPETLRGYRVERVEKLVPFLAGASTPARFGNVSIPNLRGDAAELYTNGQRRSGNLFGYRPSFLGVGSLEVVRGPASVVQGPGKKTGGLVNLVTKAASTEARAGEVFLRLGSWLPDSDDSFLHTEWGLELNQPLRENLAARFVYAGRDNETLYHRSDGRDDAQELFTTLRWEPRPDVRHDLNIQLLWQAAPQQLGVNRVTPDLIARGAYFTGAANPALGPENPPTPIDPGIADPGLLAPTGLTQIDRTDTLLSEGDFGQARVYFAQSILTVERADGGQWIHRAMLEHVNRERRNGFGYEDNVNQWTAEQRLEWLDQTELRGGTLTTTLGAVWRWEDRENYVDYWDAYAYAYDITADRRFVVGEAYPQVLASGAQPGPDGRGYTTPANPFFATPETVASTVWNPAVFLRQSWEGARRWTFAWGARADYYDVSAEDPLPNPDFGPRWSDDETFANASYEVSLSYLYEGGSLYLSHSLMHAVASNTVGDGINLYADPNGGGMVAEDDFNNQSVLVEAGWRGQTTDGRTTWRAAAFWQERDRTEFFGTNNIRVQGLELEATGRVGATLTWFGNLAYTDAHYLNSNPAEFGGATFQHVYAPGTGYEGGGTGRGFLRGFLEDFVFGGLPPADYDIPGLSDWQLQGGLAWQALPSLEVRFWGGWQSAQPGNFRQTYEIPAQHEWHTALTWTQGDWTTRLTILNLFDAENWQHNGDTFYNNHLLGRNLPRRVGLEVRRQF